MNREDVIQLAREAGLTNLLRDTQKTHDYLERFANAIKQRTLERAAQVCEDIYYDPKENNGYDAYYTRPYLECAAAIKALKEKA